jgi:hypothetical protein
VYFWKVCQEIGNPAFGHYWVVLHDYFFVLTFIYITLLDTEQGSSSEAGLTSSGLAQEGGATVAHHDSLGVAENGGDVHASLAADIHEERVGRLDQSALLVLSLLNGNVGVEEIVLNQLKSLQSKKKKPKQSV